VAQQQTQRRQALIGGGKTRQQRSAQARVLGDHGGVTGIVLGLAGQHRAAAVDGQAGDVADRLAGGQQRRQDERHRTLAQIDGEQRIAATAGLLTQALDGGLLVGKRLREELPSLPIETDGVVCLLADIDADEHIHTPSSFDAAGAHAASAVITLRSATVRRSLSAVESRRRTGWHYLLSDERRHMKAVPGPPGPSEVIPLTAHGER